MDGRRRFVPDREVVLKLLTGLLVVASLAFYLWQIPGARKRQEHGVARIAEKYGIRPLSGNTVEWHGAVTVLNMLVLPDGDVKVCVVQGTYDDPVVLCDGTEPARRG